MQSLQHWPLLFSCGSWTVGNFPGSPHQAWDGTGKAQATAVSQQTVPAWAESSASVAPFCSRVMLSLAKLRELPRGWADSVMYSLNDQNITMLVIIVTGNCSVHLCTSLYPLPDNPKIQQSIHLKATEVKHSGHYVFDGIWCAAIVTFGSHGKMYGIQFHDVPPNWSHIKHEWVHNLKQLQINSVKIGLNKGNIKNFFF